MDKGARIAVGGTLEEADRTIHPTMLTEVIEYISSHAKPLALYIYSNSRDNIDKMLSRTSSGGVTINGVFGFKAFSHGRAIYIQGSR